jgi:hypothetical protein
MADAQQFLKDGLGPARARKSGLDRHSGSKVGVLSVATAGAARIGSCPRTRARSSHCTLGLKLLCIPRNLEEKFSATSPRLPIVGLVRVLEGFLKKRVLEGLVEIIPIKPQIPTHF